MSRRKQTKKPWLLVTSRPSKKKNVVKVKPTASHPVIRDCSRLCWCFDRTEVLSLMWMEIVFHSEASELCFHSKQKQCYTFTLSYHTPTRCSLTHTHTHILFFLTNICRVNTQVTCFLSSPLPPLTTYPDNAFVVLLPSSNKSPRHLTLPPSAQWRLPAPFGASSKSIGCLFIFQPVLCSSPVSISHEGQWRRCLCKDVFICFFYKHWTHSNGTASQWLQYRNTLLLYCILTLLVTSLLFFCTVKIKVCFIDDYKGRETKIECLYSRTR